MLLPDETDVDCVTELVTGWALFAALFAEAWLLAWVLA